MDNVKYVYILGSGHSGSTLLELLISNHPKIFALGEIVNIAKVFERNSICSCGKPVLSCSVWSRVLSGFSPEEILDLDFGFDLKKIQSNLFCSNFLAVYLRLLENLQSIVQCRIFTDSSKFLEPLFLLQQIAGLDLRIIYNTRHAGGVVNSYLKKGSRFFKTSLGWAAQNKKAQIYLKNSGLPWIHVEYEKMVKNPELEIEKIFEFLDYDFDSKLVHNFKNVRHLVAGNRIRMKHQELSIKSPVPWENAFSPFGRLFLEIVNSIGSIENRKITDSCRNLRDS